MKFTDYFQRSMLDLRTRSQEAAQRNANLAAVLNTPGGYPDLERLFEGVAFLTARLEQKIDDNMPEVIHGLFSRLWPSYLRCFPAASIIQYQPSDQLANPLFYPAGTLVDSVPVDGTPCTFRTVYDVEILPITLKRQYIYEKNGIASQILNFGINDGVTFDSLKISKIRLFLAGEKAISRTQFFMFTKLLAEVRVVLRDTDKKEVVSAVLPPDSVRAVGFAENEGMVPYSPLTPLGCRILQEYFCFPEKFLFIDVLSLEQGFEEENLLTLKSISEFDLQFVLTDLPNEHRDFSLDDFRLFCTPVINIFPMKTPHIQFIKNKNEYHIIPSPDFPNNFLPYSVENVSGWLDDGKTEIIYHDINYTNPVTKSLSNNSCYSVHVSSSILDDSADMYMRFYQSSKNKDLIESVVVSLLCTNGILPEKLSLGDINTQSKKEKSGDTSFKNITNVTNPYYPPLDDEFLWKLLSSMSNNFLCYTEINSFRTLLETYDLRAGHDASQSRLLERILHGITAIKQKETDRLVNARITRGVQTKLTIDKESFVCEGDMYLFCTVLNEFMTTRATANSFHQLIVVEAAGGKEYKWPAVLGKSIR